MAKLYNKTYEQVLVETIKISEEFPVTTKIKKGESLLSLSIRDERKRRESADAITGTARRSKRAEAGEAMRNVINRKLRTLTDELLLMQEQVTLEEKRKMAALVKEGGKTAIPRGHIDGSLDGKAMTNSMIEWIDEHDFDRLLPL